MFILVYSEKTYHQFFVCVQKTWYLVFSVTLVLLYQLCSIDGSLVKKNGPTPSFTSFLKSYSLVNSKSLGLDNNIEVPIFRFIGRKT